MSDERKTITDIKSEERAQKRRDSLKRLWGIFKFVLVITIFVLVIYHRVQIGKVCHTAFDRVMKHVTLSSQTRQKAADYQQQIDGVTTN